ncbi:hypothetical protein BHM03_00013343 [Ensete ventricosum]|nr:hypothetical protein BHM03_00013343 [Ensete ventricosum]
MQNKTLIAIKAPHGTTLEVPDPDEVSNSRAEEYPQRRYRIVLRSTIGAIDVYLVRTLTRATAEVKWDDISTGGANTPRPQALPGVVEVSSDANSSLR